MANNFGLGFAQGFEATSRVGQRFSEMLDRSSERARLSRQEAIVARAAEREAADAEIWGQYANSVSNDIERQGKQLQSSALANRGARGLAQVLKTPPGSPERKLAIDSNPQQLPQPLKAYLLKADPALGEQIAQYIEEHDEIGVDQAKVAFTNPQAFLALAEKAKAAATDRAGEGYGMQQEIGRISEKQQQLLGWIEKGRAVQAQLAPGSGYAKVAQNQLSQLLSEYKALETQRNNLSSPQFATFSRGQEDVAGYTDPSTGQFIETGVSESPVYVRERGQAASLAERVRHNIAMESRPPTSISVSVGAQEKEADKVVGKFYGKAFTEMQQAGTKATQNDARLQRLDNLFNQVQTGRFRGNIQSIKAAAKGLGIDLSRLGITDDVAPAEAALALAREMALELRSPAGGAGMPGAMSDADRAFLESMVPNIETTAEGRRLIIESAKKLNQRQKEIAAKARQYRKETGNLDEGFFEAIAQDAEENPLFPEAQHQRGGEPTARARNPQTGEVLELRDGVWVPAQ